MARIIIEPESASNLRNLVSLAVENQLKIMEFGIAKTRRKLLEMEQKIGMNSRDFYERFQKGELGDDLKFIRWAGECETLERLERDYAELQGMELCS
ncbi:conserved hypothetical protein [delta proteobacterium NaphS2]|nr:conserved hypothetical protein [delta proteobacterium NaphS2]